MRNIFLFSFLLMWILTGCQPSANPFQPEKTSELRAPAYPLITMDPYISAWSFTDHLYDDAVRHWTGRKHPLTGAIRVDGLVYRFMGVEELPLKPFLPTAAIEKWEASYTEKQPEGNWHSLDYRAVGWQEGKAGFGTPGMLNLSTCWESEDIWVRRVFDLTEDYSQETVFLEYSHDDTFKLYINGIQVIATDYSANNNVLIELSAEIKNTLKPGKNIITAHCFNDVGGGYVDFGLFTREDRGNTFDRTAVQRSVHVLPTQTYYVFECGPALLDLVFTSPLLMDDLDLLSTPVNYISYQVTSLDGKTHDIQVYMEATPDWAVDNEGQQVTFEKVEKQGMTFLKTGTVEQPVLEKKGDNVRIDWGYFYLSSPVNASVSLGFGDYFAMKNAFTSGGKLAEEVPVSQLSSDLYGDVTVLGYIHNLGSVADKAHGYMLIGYDDMYAIQYFHDNRMAYWKQNGQVDIYQAFAKAARQYDAVMKRCADLDTRLMEEAEKSGGKEYAELCALAYRQAIAAHKLVEDKEGNLLFLSKENFSNGSIGTVDVTYPSSPLFLIYNPDLLKGMLTPIFYYSESGQWNKPYPSHDVGTYPIANGQTYGEDMPVEEAGNMLILTTAIALVEGNASYAQQHWPVLTTWANYLLQEGLDPGNQLCTDDFAGHLAHNANLSIKAIMGIAGYGKLADMLGEKEVAQQYIHAAREMARQWEQMADDRDHYRLTFDRPDSWSQKYNLVWDELFGMDIFPEEIAAKEYAYYLTQQNTYGLPLDIWETYTKSDWILWSACLTADPEEFKALVAPIHRYASETEARIPVSDWHDTHTGLSPNFRARSVVGGYFMKLLKDKMTKK